MLPKFTKGIGLRSLLGSKSTLIMISILLLPVLSLGSITANGFFLNLSLNFYIATGLTTFVALLLAISVLGLGFWVLDVLRLDNESNVRVLLAGGAGLGLLAVLGGVLNLFSLINHFFVFTLVVGGLIYFFYDFFSNRKKFLNLWTLFFSSATVPQRLATVFTSVVVGIYFIRGANSQVWNAHDDEHAYLVFAEKMRQTGGLGLDPFSERRLVSSLGGQSFFDAIALFFRPISAAHLFDFGVGFLLCVIFLVQLSRINFLPIFLTNILVIFFTVIPNQSMNITSTYTTTLMLLCLFVVSTTFVAVNPYAQSILLGLLCGSALTLKNTLLPYILLLGIYGLLTIYIRHRSSKVLAMSFVTLMLCVVLSTLAWSLSLLQSNGTLLYPALGRGNFGSSYGNLDPTKHLDMIELLSGFLSSFFYSAELLTITSIAGLVILLASINRMLLSDVYRSLSLLFIVVASGLVLQYGTAGAGISRYMFPVTLAAAVYSTVWLAGRHLPTGRIVLLGFVSLNLYLSFLTSGSSLSFFQDRIFVNGTDPTIATDRRSISEMQDRVPRGEIILSRLGRNYLFDFNRNPIWIVDYPGGSSLPPGLPLFDGAEKMRQYLINQNVRYVAFRYSDLFLYDDYKDRLFEAAGSVTRIQAEKTFAFQDNLREIATRYLVLFDDGNQILFDLESALPVSKGSQ